MGALHEGHLSLVRESVQRCDHTVATIFVNPTQFGPGEDLDQYPRTLDADLDGLRQAGAAAVFVPTSDEIYPPCYSTSIHPPDVALGFEGDVRPTHFAGVATIVLKLFQALPATHAFFGQKDFQQVRVIEAMVRDLNVDIEIVSCEIIREPDGLAMSSRNRYLSQEDRRRARRLSVALSQADNAIARGERNPSSIESIMRSALLADGPQNGVDSVDYAKVVDPKTLEPITEIRNEAVALIAARVGSTRLLDNRLWKQPND
jgi:pantoate--beta-alanine ligase